MAEKSVLRGHVEEILTCAMCLEILENPRTLQCLHSYCSKCLNQLTTSNGSVEGYNCPQCRRFTASTDARTVHFVVQLLDAYSAANAVNEGINCDSCKEKPAKWKCMNCVNDNYQCDRCKACHDKYMKNANQKHQVLSIDELTDENSVIDWPMYCDKHNRHILEVFCTACEQVVCVLCKVLHHDGHKSTSVAEALETTLLEMDKNVRDLENIVSDHRQQIKELQSQWQQTSKGYDEEGKKLDEELEAAIAKLRSKHKANRKIIEEKRQEGKKNTDDALADRECKIKEETLLIRWIKTTRAKATGACLLTEFQGNLISKVRSTVQKTQSIIVHHSTRCFPWDINLVNDWKQEHQFQLQNTVQQMYSYSRLSIVWGQLAAVNHYTKKLFTYNMDGTAEQSLTFTDNIKEPLVVVQVSDANGVLAAASGLYLINRSAQILQVIDQGDFSDVCVKKDKTTGRTQIISLEWNKGQVKNYVMGIQVKLAKTIQLENYDVDNNVRNPISCNTFAVSEDCIFVCIVQAARIVKYDHNGNRLQVYPNPQTGLRHPSICGIDNKSALLVTDSDNCKVVVLRNGNFECFLQTPSSPWYVVFENSDTLWVLNRASISKYKFNGYVNMLKRH